MVAVEDDPHLVFAAAKQTQPGLGVGGPLHPITGDRRKGLEISPSHGLIRLNGEM